MVLKLSSSSRGDVSNTADGGMQSQQYLKEVLSKEVVDQLGFPLVADAIFDCTDFLATAETQRSRSVTCRDIWTGDATTQTHRRM